MDMSQVKKADFKIEDIFEVSLSKGDNKISELPKGDIPLISSGETNNGVTGFVAKGDGKAQIFKPGSLTVDMFGNVFVQKTKFYAVSHGRVNILKTKEKTPILAKSYLQTVIQTAIRGKFSYSNMCTSGKLKTITISLPVTNDGKPDWELMEEYIKYIQNKQLEQIKKKNAHEAALLEKLYGDQTPTEPAPVDKAEFKVEDIFEVIKKTETETGHSTRHKLTEKFSLPGITGATTNNGIGCFVDPNEHDAIDNVITVAPHSGAVFYHPYKIAISKNVYALKPKNNSKAVCSYLTAILSAMNKGKFDYSNLASWGRYKDLTITLPIDNQGNPNWEWMEAYIAWIQYRERERVESYVQLKRKQSSKN